MKNVLFAALVVFASLPAFAQDEADAKAEAEKLCRQWAQDEGVAAGEMEAYVSTCVANYLSSN